MEKTIGFNIEVRGTEEENLKMTSLKKSIFETADRLKTLRDLTKGNVEAQKEYAATIVSLETHLKAETKALNELQASQVKSSLAINNAAGSYNSLVEENRKLSEELRALPIDVTSEQFKKMSIQMAENQLKMNQFNEGIGRFHGNVGNYTGKVFTYSKGIKGLADTALVAAQAFGVNSKEIEVAINVTQVFSVVNRNAKDVMKALTVSKDADTVATKEQTLAQRIYAAVVGQSTGAMKAFKIALASTGVGLLIIGIGVLVSQIMELIEATNGQEDAQKKLNERNEEYLRQLDEIVDKREKERNAGLYGLDVLKRELEILKATGASKDDILKKETEILQAEIQNIRIREESYKDVAKGQGKAAEDAKNKLLELSKERLDKENEIDAISLKFKKESYDEDVKEKEESEAKKEKAAEEAWKKELSFLDKAINEAAQKYAKDTANFIKNIDEKNKKSNDFYKQEINLILDNAIKDAEIKNDAVAKENARYQKALESLERSYNSDLKKTEAFLKAKELLLAEHNSNIEKINNGKTLFQKLFPELTDEEANKYLSDINFIVTNSLDLINNIEESYFQTRMQRLQLELDLRRQALESQNETDQNILKNQLDKGLISEQQYRDKKYQMDAEFQKRQLELRRKQAQEERKIKTIELTVDYAKTIAEIWLQALASADSVATFGLSGTTKALISTGIASGNYLAQLGFMNAQKFSKGGLVVGSGSSTSDSIPMFASNRESINNAKTTGMFYNELSAMNVAGGGVPFPNAQPPSFDFISNSITKQDLAIMVQAINDKRVYIVESEIRGAHKKAEIFERNNEF